VKTGCQSWTLVGLVSQMQAVFECTLIFFIFAKCISFLEPKH
jgi:hypothetical protein